MAKLITLEVIIKVEDAMYVEQAENYMYAAAEQAIEAMEDDTYQASLIECEVITDREVPDED